MIELSSILPMGWQERIGWALVHSVWQIALVAVVYAIGSATLRRASANTRYLWGCFALLAMVALPLATLVYQSPASSLKFDRTSQVLAKLELSQDIGIEEVETQLVPSEEVLPNATPPNSEALAPNEIAPLSDPIASEQEPAIWLAKLETLLPWLSLGWLMGVALLALRPLFGLLIVHRLKTRGLTPLSVELRQIAGRLMAELGVHRAVQFAQSALVEVPSVVGYLRPMVLLPASAVTGLTVDQVELLLAHELAHVRRHDYLVNLLQTLIETLLFYHPAMWWLSAQIRNERECCCDDVVVALCGNRKTYIHTLWAMEQQRAAAVPILAARGGSLAHRIRRLAFGHSDRIHHATGWLGSFFILCLLALLLSYGQSFAEEPVTDAKADSAEPDKATESLEELPTARLVGRIMFDGITSKSPRPNFSYVNPPVGTSHSEGETILVGETGGIANVVVWARSKDIPAPPLKDQQPPAILEAQENRFGPHILPFWNIASLRFVNKMEPTVFHWRPTRNPQINRLLRTDEEIGVEIEHSERIPTKVSSNLQPWMSAYVLPLDHPFFAVTDREGRFEIENLPLGRWEFAIWHERSGWLETDRFPTGKFSWDIKRGENSLGDLLVDLEAISQQNPTASQATEATFDPMAIVRVSPTFIACPDKKAYQAQIVKALEEIKDRRQGQLVIGRVLVEGDDDPTIVYSQMEILADGYFATAAKNLIDPIGFRMHGYAPFDLQLKGKMGDVIDVGTIQMRQLPDAELSPVVGRVALEDDNVLDAVSVKAHIDGGPVNSPSGGIDPRSRWPDPIDLPVDSGGRFYQPGISPIEYNFVVTAPGYVQQLISIQVEPREVTNLKTITLEKPRRLWLDAIVSETTPFNLDDHREIPLQGGSRWKMTPHPYRWDLEFDQRNGRLYFDWSYGPIFLADLGPGELSDFLEIDAETATGQPKEIAVNDGHVYLLRRPDWEQGGGHQLALFKVRLEKPQPGPEPTPQTVIKPPNSPPPLQPRQDTSVVKNTNINALDREGFSQLHRAASGGHAERVRILLKQGADVNVRQGTYLGTPLQYAAFHGHGETVQALLDHGADVDAHDANNRTPLIWAAMAGHSDVIRRLLDAGSDIDATNLGGWTPLYYATSRGHQKAANLLIDRGAKEFTANSLGKTPHEFAIETGNLQQLLMEVRQVLPDGWQAEITPNVPTELKPSWLRNDKPVVVVWRTAQTLGEPNAPGMAGGSGPDDRPWELVHPRFYLINVDFLSLDQYELNSFENRDKELRRTEFVKGTLSGIPWQEKGPYPPPPAAFRPENGVQESLVREYAQLWAQTEPKELPTHYYRTLAFIFNSENYILRDKVIDAEREKLRTDLLLLVSSYESGAGTVGEAEASEVIATVLGQDITRKELEPPPEWHQTRTEHIRKHGITSGLESLDQYRRQRFSVLVAKPLIEAYKDENNLAPTDEEINEFIAHHAKAQETREKEYLDKLQKLRSEITRFDSSTGQQPEDLKKIEAIRKETKAIESLISHNSGRRRDEAHEQFFAKWQLERWKLQRSLYERFGGRVIWQQVGPEAIDAMRDFFRQEEAQGRLAILDEHWKHVFWEPFEKENPGVIVQDADRIFENLWSLSESPDNR